MGNYTLGITFASNNYSEPFAYKVLEPLTILVSLTAISIGALLKREYSRKNSLAK